MRTSEGVIINEYRNLAKAIAFASLWIYAAIVTQGVEALEKIWGMTVIMSIVVIYLFDRGPDKK